MLHVKIIILNVLLFLYYGSKLKITIHQKNCGKSREHFEKILYAQNIQNHIILLVQS